GPLNIQVPVLGVGQGKVRVQRQVGQRFRKLTADRRVAVERIGKVGKADLRRLKIRRSADRRLQGPTLAGVVRLIKNSVSRCDQPLAASGRVPGEAHPRRESLLERRDQACGHTLVSGIKQSGRSIGHHGGLPARNPKSLPVLDLGVGERQIITQAKVQGEPRGRLERILDIRVHGISPDTAFKITQALQKDDRLAKQEAGERIGYDGWRRENKEAIAGDALQRVDLEALVSASEFELVTAAHPAQRTGDVVSILISIARPRNRIADGGIACHLNGGRTYGQVQAGSVSEAELRGSRVTGVLTIKEFISQE